MVFLLDIQPLSVTVSITRQVKEKKTTHNNFIITAKLSKNNEMMREVLISCYANVTVIR